MKWRISVLLILGVILFLSACSIFIPPTLTSSNGSVQGNQLIIAREVIYPAGTLIEGDIVAIGADVTINPGAMVKGNILVLGSSLENQGIIKGNLNLLAGNAILRNGSLLNGDINQLFNHVVIAEKAEVTGEINTISYPGAPIDSFGSLIVLITDRFNSQNWLMMDIVRVIITSLLALLAGIFLKNRMAVMVQQMQNQPLLTWGAGVLSFAVIPILSILLIITICLSPLGLILIILLALAYIFGWIALGITSGSVLMLWLKAKWPFELQAFIGALVFGIMTTLVGRIPCLGWTLNILLGCIGLGAILITRIGSKIESHSLE